MKTLMILILTGFAMGITSAKADVTIKLADINTNDCGRAQNEITLLNSSRVQINTSCSEYSPGGYAADNGRLYDYRLTTYAVIPGTPTPGSTYKLADINTNNCNYAQQEASLLNSTRAGITAVCSDYIPGGYPSNNGQAYNYRVTTYLIAK